MREVSTIDALETRKRECRGTHRHQQRLAAGIFALMGLLTLLNIERLAP